MTPSIHNSPGQIPQGAEFMEQRPNGRGGQHGEVFPLFGCHPRRSQREVIVKAVEDCRPNVIAYVVPSVTFWHRDWLPSLHTFEWSVIHHAVPTRAKAVSAPARAGASAISHVTSLLDATT